MKKRIQRPQVEPSLSTPPVITASGSIRNELRAAILGSLRQIDTNVPIYLTADILTDALLSRFAPSMTAGATPPDDARHIGLQIA